MYCLCLFLLFFFFFKQKTAYEMRISDWSSDVCSSDLYLTYAEVSHAHICCFPCCGFSLPPTAALHMQTRSTLAAQSRCWPSASSVYCLPFFCTSWAGQLPGLGGPKASAHCQTEATLQGQLSEIGRAHV